MNLKNKGVIKFALYSVTILAPCFSFAQTIINGKVFYEKDDSPENLT